VKRVKVEKHYLSTEVGMKRYLFLGILIFFIVLGALPIWASGKAEKDGGEQDAVYIINNQHNGHIQVLGGQSVNAVNGLKRAQERARFMEVRDPATKPKNGSDNVVRKRKK
jgi:hypothetical protein